MPFWRNSLSSSSRFSGDSSAIRCDSDSLSVLSAALSFVAIGLLKIRVC
jgi:hypothetical protein